MCYPLKLSKEINNITANINLQVLLDHTTARILKINCVHKVSLTHLILYFKRACDGSTRQDEYKEVLPEETEFISNTKLFISLIVSLKLVDINTNETVWENPAPSSRFCHPILIKFSIETPEKTTSIHYI